MKNLDNTTQQPYDTYPSLNGYSSWYPGETCVKDRFNGFPVPGDFMEGGDVAGDPFVDSLDITDTSEGEDNNCRKLDDGFSESCVNRGNAVDDDVIDDDRANPMDC